MSIQSLKGISDSAGMGPPGPGPVSNRAAEPAAGNLPSQASAVAQAAVTTAQVRDTQATRTQTRPPAQPKAEEIRKAVQQVQEAVSSMTKSLQFSVDEKSGKTVITLTDTETGEVIRQVPSKEVIELAKNLDRVQGMLLKQKA